MSGEDMILSYSVKFQWDDVASVWIATSDDIPGLVLESESFDTLAERVRLAVPEPIGLNEQILYKNNHDEQGIHDPVR